MLDSLIDRGECTFLRWLLGHSIDYSFLSLCSLYTVLVEHRQHKLYHNSRRMHVMSWEPYEFGTVEIIIYELLSRANIIHGLPLDYTRTVRTLGYIVLNDSCQSLCHLASDSKNNFHKTLSGRNHSVPFYDLSQRSFFNVCCLFRPTHDRVSPSDARLNVLNVTHWIRYNPGRLCVLEATPCTV